MGTRTPGCLLITLQKIHWSFIGGLTKSCQNLFSTLKSLTKEPRSASILQNYDNQPRAEACETDFFRSLGINKNQKMKGIFKIDLIARTI